MRSHVFLARMVVSRLLFVLPLVLVSGSLIAQSGKWSLTFTPAVVPAPNLRYAVQFGAAYNLNDRFQLLAELATATGRPYNRAVSNSRYVRVKPEIRFMFPGLGRELTAYTGLQFSFSQRSWVNNGSGSFFESNGVRDSVFTYSSATIHSPVVTGAIQLGGMAKLGKHLYFDIFGGLGLRSVFTDYASVVDQQKAEAYPPRCMIVCVRPAWTIEGSLVRFQLNMGARLMYQF